MQCGQSTDIFNNTISEARWVWEPKSLKRLRRITLRKFQDPLPYGLSTRRQQFEMFFRHRCLMIDINGGVGRISGALQHRAAIIWETRCLFFVGETAMQAHSTRSQSRYHVGRP